MVALVRARSLRPFWLALAVSLLFIGVESENTARALPANDVADVAFGQAGLNANACGAVTASSLCIGGTGGGVAIDGAGNVYISDGSRNRVLEYDTPLTTDTVADRVFGQGGNFTTAVCNSGGVSASSLCAPAGLAIDGASNLYVVDSLNARVLVYGMPLTTDTVADAVFGQGGSFTSNLCGAISASSMCPAAGVAVDGVGNVYISTGNRVLEFDTPLTTDMVADRVFGQGGNFTTGTCNLGGITASSLCKPIGLAVDGAGNLYVADTVNNRALEYHTPLTTDTVADRVFGQLNFVNGGCNDSGISASVLCFAAADGRIAVDAAGNVYIGDYNNSRALEYDTPLTTDTIADRVYGQNGLTTTGTCNVAPVSASVLCTPTDIAITASGVLFVVDAGNNRVLAYRDALKNGVPADAVFGQLGSFSTAECDKGGRSASTLCLSAAGAVAVDNAGNVYVADQGNNRVLEYDTPLTTNTVADRVFGQAGSFAIGTCNNGGLSASSLCAPAAVGLDAADNLYVVDAANNRVLVYNSPLTTDTLADVVFGQGGLFTTGTCNNGGISASSLCTVTRGDVAVDGGGNVYLVDYANHRVLEYDTPLTTDTVADRVVGGDGTFTTGSCNAGGFGGISATSLCFATGVAVDGAGNVHIVDSGNNRVLEYDTPIASGTVADRVFGQGGSFTSGSCNLIGPTAGSLCTDATSGVNPRGMVDVDASGNVYITDTYNSRVLEFDTPLTTDQLPDRAYGHVAQDYGNDRCRDGGLSRAGLCRPHGIEVAADGSLYVVDSDENRMLSFVAGADVDGDGCSDVEEFGVAQLAGGRRDPDSPWDFYSVPIPALFSVGDPTVVFRDSEVTAADAQAVFAYARIAAETGTTEYEQDLNQNGRKDGEDYDRTPSVTPGEPWRSEGPDGSVNAQDAQVAFIQAGHSCAAPP